MSKKMSTITLPATKSFKGNALGTSPSAGGALGPQSMQTIHANQSTVVHAYGGSSMEVATNVTKAQKRINDSRVRNMKTAIG
jgi:hypothetical protein